MSNWKFTTIHHPARIEMGLSVLQYCIFDIYYRSQTNPDYNVKGWAKNSYGEIARFLGVSKGTVFGVVDKGVKAGFIEVNPANPTLKKTTKKWYKKAYEEENTRSKNERKAPNRSENERSENERQTVEIVQKMNGSVQKMNVINKDKLNTNSIKDNRARANENKITEEDLKDFEMLEMSIEQERLNAQKETPSKVAQKVSIEEQMLPNWMQVATDMAEYLKGDGADQWGFLCDAAGGYVEPITITTAWAGRNCDASYPLKNWKKQIPKLTNWIRNELKSQSIHGAKIKKLENGKPRTSTDKLVTSSQLEQVYKELIAEGYE